MNSAKIFQRLSSGNKITLYETKMNVLQRETSGEKKTGVHSTGV
jgi:hypothetical protein